MGGCQICVFGELRTPLAMLMIQLSFAGCMSLFLPKSVDTECFVIYCMSVIVVQLMTVPFERCSRNSIHH